MAYRADIEIGVRGIRQLEQLRSEVNKTATAVDSLNNVLGSRGRLAQTIGNYTDQLNKAANSLRNVSAGTAAETKAVREYVTALNLANAARERQNRLIAQEIANQRRVVATANAGFGIQGPQAANIRPARGPASPIRGAANIAGSPAALAAATGGGVSGRFGGIVSNAVIGGAFPLLFGQGGGAATGGAIGGAVGGLFGGAGGFAGSLLGTLIGDIVSQGAKIKELGADIGFSADQTKRLEAAFALAGVEADKFQNAVQNIRGLGLTLDDQADAIALVSKLTEDYGGRIDKVTAAYADFVEKGKVGIADINKFTSQGIPILDELEKKFGTNRDGVLALAKDGKISAQQLSDALVAVAQTSDKTSKAVKSGWNKVWEDLSMGSSKSVKAVVAVFSTLIGQSSSIGGSIASVFSNLYLQMVNGALDAGARISRVLASTARAAANYAATIELGGLNIGASVGKRTAKGAENIFTNLDKQFQQIRNAPAAPRVGAISVPGQAPAGTAGGRTKRPKQAPENITQQLQQELVTLQRIGEIENQIRDFRRAGRDLLIPELELEKTRNELNLQRVQALQKANYESERQVINLTFEERLQQAIKLAEDQRAEIEKTRFDAYKDYLSGLTDENGAIQAQIDGTSRQFAIEVEIRRLKKEKATINEQELRTELQKQYALQDQLNLVQKQREIQATGTGLRAGFIGSAAAVFEQAFANPETRGQAKQLAEMETQLMMLQSVAGATESAVLGIGDAFGTMFTDGIASLVTGTQTVQQVFAQFLKSIAEALLSAAAQMIATYIAIGIARAFAFGGNSGGSGLNINDALKYSSPIAGFASGGYVPGGFQAFAEGGLVTRPTMGLVGEGGEAEYIIPASKMRTAMERYSQGVRGSAVIPTGSDTDTGAAPSNSAASVIDVRYTVERINNVEYVTADQFRQGMAQAAREGAQRGEQQTLRRLQNAPSVRRRVGI